GEVNIGSFSDGLGVSTNGRRLYLPVRSDANLTFIDVNQEGQLSCGGPFGTRHTCTAPYRSGSTELVNPTVSLVMPPDPVDVYVGDLAADFAPTSSPDDPAFRGDYILMAHREGWASLMFDQERPGGPMPTKRPRLAATVDELAPEQVTITYEPGAKRAWIPSAEVAAIVRLGIGIDGDPTQSYLFGLALRIGARQREEQPRHPLRPPAGPQPRVYRLALARSPDRRPHRCRRQGFEHARPDSDLP
ncbi:MAG: hypothetical protein JRD92_04145, partial [Deltaproteobacteria bacterium]|nr:hypothetical protein [Deltaproteobacteria bacterium]